MKYAPERLARVYLCQEYTDIGAVEADSREEAFAAIQRLADAGGALTPKRPEAVETLEEFLDRTLAYWEPRP